MEELWDGSPIKSDLFKLELAVKNVKYTLCFLNHGL